MEVDNRTDKTVWLGLYNLNDTIYWATTFPWGARKKLAPGERISVSPPPGAKVQVVFWDSGAFGTRLAPPKAMFTSAVSIAGDADGTYYVYNRRGEPRPIDKIDHIFVLMLENRSFDNLLGWLYAPENRPPRNIPERSRGPTYAGLSEHEFWNTKVANEHDTAPESERVYARKGALSDRKPDPDPLEVCPSFVEQMFGTETPAPGAVPTMWGFVQNYARVKNNNDVNGIMECYTPDQVPVLSWLAKQYAVCDRWFAPLPSQTWPSRSFVHAGTSFGRLNNCDQINVEDCIPNFFVYAGKPTIFDELDRQFIRWGVYQDAVVQVSLTSFQFWTVLQKLDHAARPLSALAADLRSNNPPRYVFIEPAYTGGTLGEPNDQHPPSKVSSGEQLIRNVYDLVSQSPTWKKSVLIVTYDEHGGCYDHVPPPHAPPPDNYPAQFSVGNINPFQQYGPRVPAVLVSPYVEPGTVFRGEEGKEFDHTSILASVRDWMVPGMPDLLGLNPRIEDAPVIWPVLTRSAPRPPERPPEPLIAGVSVSGDERLTARELELLALAEAERQLVDEAALGVVPGVNLESRLMQLANSVLVELEGVERPDDLPEDLRPRYRKEG